MEKGGGPRPCRRRTAARCVRSPATAIHRGREPTGGGDPRLPWNPHGMWSAQIQGMGRERSEGITVCSKPPGGQPLTPEWDWGGGPLGVAISSAMRRTPYSSQSSRARRRYPAAWNRMPPAPCGAGGIVPLPPGDGSEHAAPVAHPKTPTHPCDGFTRMLRDAGASDLDDGLEDHGGQLLVVGREEVLQPPAVLRRERLPESTGRANVVFTGSLPEQSQRHPACELRHSEHVAGIRLRPCSLWFSKIQRSPAIPPPITFTWWIRHPHPHIRAPRGGEGGEVLPGEARAEEVVHPRLRVAHRHRVERVPVVPAPRALRGGDGVGGGSVRGR